MHSAGVMTVTDTRVNEAGGVVWWKRVGKADRARLYQAWVGAGLDPDLLPGEHGPEVALHRAADEQKAQHRLVRRLPDKSWAIIDESNPSPKAVSFDVTCRVLLNPVGQLTVEPAGHPLTRELMDAFHQAQNELSATDLGTWLVKLANQAMAVTLRPGGGLYFVPHKSLELWRTISRVVEASTGCQLWLIPAVKGTEAVAAVLEAVRAEAQSQLDGMTEDLQQGKLGTRGLNNRVGRCEEVAEMLAAYDELLGSSLDGMKVTLKGMRSRLAAAALIASGEDEEEAA